MHLVSQQRVGIQYGVTRMLSWSRLWTRSRYTQKWWNWTSLFSVFHVSPRIPTSKMLKTWRLECMFVNQMLLKDLKVISMHKRCMSTCNYHGCSLLFSNIITTCSWISLLQRARVVLDDRWHMSDCFARPITNTRDSTPSTSFAQMHDGEGDEQQIKSTSGVPIRTIVMVLSRFWLVHILWLNKKVWNAATFAEKFSSVASGAPQTTHRSFSTTL
jgi:hypothetical protein